MRKGLLNAFAQSDISGTDPATSTAYKLLNFGGIDVPVGNMIYVDSTLPTDQGKINSSLAFQSPMTAINSAVNGCTIFIRPGTYQFDGFALLRRIGVTIIGYGATFTPLTPGQECGLGIIGNSATVKGIKFDGGITSGAVDVTDGVIQVQGANNVTLQDIQIFQQNGVGIQLVDGYNNVSIVNCSISSCNEGITGALPTTSIKGIEIDHSTISFNRHEGIQLTGVDNIGNVILSNIRIADCDFDSNNLNGGGHAAILMDHGAVTVLITGCRFTNSYDGVNLVKSIDANIIGNTFQSPTNSCVTLNGYKSCKISSNLMDCSNLATGGTYSPRGIVLTGYIVDTGPVFSGPVEISDNHIFQVTAGGRPLDFTNAANALVMGNHISGLGGCYFTSCLLTSLISNLINMGTSSTIPIALDAGTAGGWSFFNIIANRIYAPNAPRIIATTDPHGIGVQSNLRIMANSVTDAINPYTSGIVSNIAGAAPTSVIITGNTPASTTVTAGAFDPRYGWVNDGMTALSSKELDILGVKVVGARDTGWGGVTGGVSKTLFTGYAGQTISGTYNQTQIQTMDNNVAAVCQHMVALLQALTTHGLIGT